MQVGDDEAGVSGLIVEKGAGIMISVIMRDPADSR